MRVVALLALLLTCAAPPVFAHSARLGRTQPIGDTGLQLAPWYGDGILGPDPIRAVVLDDQGRLHTVSAISVKMKIECDPNANCTVWDRIGRRAFIPDRAAFAPSEILVQDKKVLDDPDHYKAEFGFASKDITLAQHLRVEAGALAANPVALLLTTLWWIMIWLMLRGGWRVSRNISLRRSLRWPLAITTGFVGCVLIMASAFLWLSSPTTLTMLGANMAIGAIAVWLLQRVQRRPGRTGAPLAG